MHYLINLLKEPYKKYTLEELRLRLEINNKTSSPIGNILTITNTVLISFLVLMTSVYVGDSNRNLGLMSILASKDNFEGMNQLGDKFNVSSDHFVDLSTKIVAFMLAVVVIYTCFAIIMYIHRYIKNYLILSVIHDKITSSKK